MSGHAGMMKVVVSSSRRDRDADNSDDDCFGQAERQASPLQIALDPTRCTDRTVEEREPVKGAVGSDV
jgi:hypothetical protein